MIQLKAPPTICHNIYNCQSSEKGGVFGIVSRAIIGQNIFMSLNYDVTCCHGFYGDSYKRKSSPKLSCMIYDTTKLYYVGIFVIVCSIGFLYNSFACE